MGEFDVTGVISDGVEQLWKRTGPQAGIDRDTFFGYFRGQQIGHAIQIGKVRLYDKPRPIEETYGIRAPQSFIYL